MNATLFLLLLTSCLFSLANSVLALPNSLIVLNSSKFVDGTKNLNIKGEVRNNSSYTEDFVQVTGTFYDSAGHVVGIEHTFPNPSAIPAWKEAPFLIILSKANIPVEQIANYSIDAKSLR